MKQGLWLLIALIFAGNVLAGNIDTYRFSSVDQEQQYRHLTASLRCPKCQNNSIADSDAMIAADMRLKVYELLRSGQTPEQIKAWMVARYGHFVVYEPPVMVSTIILWVGPLLFIVTGTWLIILRSRRRIGSALDTEQQARLQQLLNNGKPL